MHNFKFHPQAQQDLEKLNHSVRLLFSKKLTQILINPEIGKKLGNKNNLNLTGLKKAYFGHKRYRIVYQVVNDDVVVFIVSVGKREDMKVYKQAYKRIKNNALD